MHRECDEEYQEAKAPHEAHRLAPCCVGSDQEVRDRVAQTERHQRKNQAESSLRPTRRWKRSTGHLIQIRRDPAISKVYHAQKDERNEPNNGWRGVGPWFKDDLRSIGSGMVPLDKLPGNEPEGAQEERGTPSLESTVSRQIVLEYFRFQLLAIHRVCRIHSKRSPSFGAVSTMDCEVFPAFDMRGRFEDSQEITEPSSSRREGRGGHGARDRGATAAEDDDDWCSSILSAECVCFDLEMSLNLMFLMHILSLRLLNVWPLSRGRR